MTNPDSMGDGADRSVIRENLARNVLLLRGRLGLSQQALAAAAGLHQTQVSKLECQEVDDPAGFVLLRLAQRLEVPVEVLTGDERGLECHLVERDAREDAREAAVDKLDEQRRAEDLVRDATAWWLLTRARLREAINAGLTGGDWKLPGIDEKVAAAIRLRVSAAPAGLALLADPVEVPCTYETDDHDEVLTVRFVEGRRSHLAAALLAVGDEPTLAVTVKRRWPSWQVVAIESTAPEARPVADELDHRARTIARQIARSIEDLLPGETRTLPLAALTDAILRDVELRRLTCAFAPHSDEMAELFDPEDGVYELHVDYIDGRSSRDMHGNIAPAVDEIKSRLLTMLHQRLEDQDASGEWVKW